jgi:hypothetical protein
VSVVGFRGAVPKSFQTCLTNWVGDDDDDDDDVSFFPKVFQTCLTNWVMVTNWVPDKLTSWVITLLGTY